MHKCTLCPEKKNIYSDAILAEHLTSRMHKLRLKKYYDKHEAVLKQRMDELKTIRSRQVSKSTRNYRKFAMLNIHFKLLAQFKAYELEKNENTASTNPPKHTKAEK